MNEHTLGIFRRPERRALGALAGLAALQIGALGVWSLFLSVAHYGYPSYVKLMTAAWLGSALLVACVPRWRWFIFAATAICLPRVAGIAMNGPAHHLLFAWFAGSALGLLLRAASALVGSAAVSGEAVRPPRRGAWFAGPGFAQVLLAAVLIAALLRAYARFYGVDALWQLAPAIDREVTPGVSANYGLYLALLLFLNFAGPLLFCAASALYPIAGARGAIAPDTVAAGPLANATVAAQLAWGLGVGAAVHLVALGLQAMGWLRLAAGAGDHWQPAGRLPGILTDSGASTLLTPFLVATLVLLGYHRLARGIPAGQRGDLLRRYVLPAGAAAVMGLAVLVPISYHHGRAFLLGAVGAGALAVMLVVVIAWRTGVSRVNVPRYWLVAAAVGALMIFALVALVAQSSVPAIVVLRDSLERMWPQIKAGNWNVALNTLDEGRAHYLRVGLALIEEAPWIGHGINSFQIELPRFQELAPRIQSDNPAMLVLGLLSDFGVLGTVVIGVWLLWPMLCCWRVRRTSDTRTLWLLGVGVAFLPGSLIGFHLVLAEFSALLFVPQMCALALQTRHYPPAESAFVSMESEEDAAPAPDRLGAVLNSVACVALCAWIIAALVPAL